MTTQGSSIAVLVPVVEPPLGLLDELVDSVRAQAGADWQLVLVDASGGSGPVAERLARWAADEPRIRHVDGGGRLGISAATRLAARHADAEVLTLLDHDDRLGAGVLAAAGRRFAADPDLELLTTDEDQLTADGRRVEPAFRGRPSAWQLLHFNAATHLVLLRRRLWDALGGPRPAYDGAQDHDLLLRAVEGARGVGHLPLVGYHWRRVAGSVAATATAKPWAFEAGRRAIADACRRRGLGAPDVRPAAWPGVWRLDWPPAPTSAATPGHVVLHGRGAPDPLWRAALAAAGWGAARWHRDRWPDADDGRPWLVVAAGLKPDPAVLESLARWSVLPGTDALAAGACAGRRRVHLGFALDRGGRARTILPDLHRRASGPGLMGCAPREVAASGDQLLWLARPAVAGAGSLSGRRVTIPDLLALAAAAGPVLHLPDVGAEAGPALVSRPEGHDLSASPLWPRARERVPWVTGHDAWCPRHPLLVELGVPAPPTDG